MKEKRLNHGKVLDLLPKRKKESHKGDYGRILLLCGSVGYTGAPALVALGALRSGAGLVYLGVPGSIYAVEAVKLNEAMVFPLPEKDGKISEEAMGEILRKLPQMDAVVVGPGLGQGRDIQSVVTTVLAEATCPVVLDADGINAIATHTDILRERHYPTILTPHLGEFKRLCPDLGENIRQRAISFASEMGCVLLLKGHRTLITDGVTSYENTTGNPGMATGGSGDVLSGIIASLIGQKIPILEATACGAWLHGKAGDLCARKIGTYGMLPTDMLEVLPRLMK